MQFVNIQLNGTQQWAFALTKWEATAFSVAAKNNKAPEDEQAVRFDVYDGRALVWCTDGTHMVYLEPKASDRSIPGDHSVSVPSGELKKRAAKCKVSEVMLIPVGSTEVYVAGIRDLGDGDDVTAELAATMTKSGALSWGREQLEAATALVHVAEADPSAGDGRWETSGRFCSTIGAVSKATAGSGITWIRAPAGDGPLVIRTTDDLDESPWTIVIMPTGTPLEAYGE